MSKPISLDGRVLLAGAGHVRPHRGRLRPHQHGDDRGPPPLAGASGRPTAPSLAAGDAALDLCCGTGDLALELRERVGATGRVVGADFSERMLELAQEKASERGANDVTFEWADAMELPYSDASFDAITVGFGVRNFADVGGGIREMTRVLKPGGRCVILEITQPQKPPLSTFFGIWFDRIVPVIGRIAGDPEAYSYLPESVRGFPPPEGLAAPHGRGGARPRSATRSWPAASSRSTRAYARPELARREPLRSTTARHPGDGRGRSVAAVAHGDRRGRLAELVEGYGEALGGDARATLKAGGKRLRPMLVLLCAGPEAGDAALRGAAAIELVHMATLVHDDVLDQAPLRRGLPTVVATSGRERATAVGDLLLSRAFAELGEGGDAGGERQVELLARRLGRAWRWASSRSGATPGTSRPRPSATWSAAA